MNEEKLTALIRRTNKLLDWLKRPDYAYENEQSIEKLLKLINLIIWALERSIPPYNWRHFKVKFDEARNTLVNPDGEPQNNYTLSIQELSQTLIAYQDYIKSHDFEEITYND